MNGYLVKSKEELIEKIEEIVKEGSLVGCGGSMTLFETGVMDHLRSGRYEFIDRYKEGLAQEDVKKYIGQHFQQMHIFLVLML